MARLRNPIAVIIGGLFIATMSGCGGSSTTSFPPPTISSFTASRSTITTGDPVTLSWTVSNETSISIDNAIGAVTGTSTTVKPTTTTTYTLTATGSTGLTSSASVTVTVVPPASISQFMATPGSVNPGDSVSLSWIVTGAATLSIDNGVGAVTGTSTTVMPAATTTYTLTATNAASAAVTAQTTVTVINSPPTISSFVASPAVLTPVSSGISSTDLHWSTSQATSLTIDNGVGPVTGTDVQVSPGASTTFTLTASNAFPPSATAKVAVGVWSYLTILAGVIDGNGSADGPSSQAFFGGPTGTSVGVSGEVYVADNANNTIRKIASGQVTTIAGKPGVTGATDGIGSAARFNTPIGIAADKVGNLFVADTGNNTIRKIDPSGTVTTIAGTAGVTGHSDGTGASASFNDPEALAVDSIGNVYVADRTNCVIRKITPTGVVTTFAGTAGVAGSNDGIGGAALFDDPSGLAFDAGENLYVADQANNEVRKITPAGIVTTLAGTAGTSGSQDGTGPDARFNRPTGLTIENGDLFVSDQDNSTIREVSPSGVVTTFAGTARSQGNIDGTGTNATFSHPWGLSTDLMGNLYVADSGNDNIRKITPGAVVSSFAGVGPPGDSYADGSGTTARFSYLPGGLSVDSAGDVFVADTRNAAIRMVTPQGLVTTVAGGPKTTTFVSPQATAVDSADNVYVADGSNTIMKIAPDGQVSTLAGNPSGPPGFADGTGSAARFWGPESVAVDSGGNVFVADTDNFVIRKVSPSGVVTTIAGIPGQQGHNDGPGNQATFRAPVAIAVDGAGNVYVGDIDMTGTNGAVRRITPEGVVSTLTRGLADPGSIAADPAGNVYVVCSGDYTVKMVSPQGSVVTLIGTPGIDGTILGPLPAGLGNPEYGIAITPDGNLVVAVSSAVVTLAP